MSELIIREARTEDAEQLLTYLKQIGGETDNVSFGAEGLPLSVEEEQNYIRAVQQDKHSVMYVAIKGDKIVGDGSLSGMPRRMCHRATLGISVAKAEWNRGIGTMLMRALVDYAKDNGLEILNLEVKADNLPAIHLYEKFGFQKIGISPAFAKVNEEYSDFLLMYLDLR